MTRRTFSGREAVKALRKHDFKIANRGGSHVTLVYRHPETDEYRRVTVVMHDEIATGTLQKIAKQAGADDFQKFCEWIGDTL
ncbi:type II toxin-antitoxin system HicA family toxin [Halopelagius longus]|uniref:Predicted RNA binding protein YcfA, dsRBD-like fold, HicA-like mRNA interferase family n=1 Tax=Halopelagius longus TaxID=1236180 RepID=A0A1H0XP58_9EURY|nr:type II toxin-antitoxin system HicA family toxin [Halopelagius longus]RDI71980.1 type II toxin-antitoxin system HicA family toxin [Halopelagius longus]SDQ04599.1 Predicted RNA binding protein YcfA, dsRBD-like fold, HicA-like mRNA interferase family [Halopelagius longus]